MESRWNVLTLNDKKILQFLYENKEGSIVSQISKDTNLQPKQIYNSLKRLEKLKFVDTLSKCPLLVRLNLMANITITFFQVECPKCEQTRYIDPNQNTVVCKNPTCKTKSNKQTRFYITKNRIVGTPEYIELKERVADKRKNNLGIKEEDYF